MIRRSSIAVVVVNYKTAPLVLSCLDSVACERESLPDLHAVVVDNASPDNSAQVLATRLKAAPYADWVQFLPLKLNGGFGWGNNQAIQRLLQAPDPPDAILLLNPDAQVEPGAIVALIEEMQRRPDAGAVGSQLMNSDGSLAGSSFRFPSIGREWMRGHGIGPLGRLLGIRSVLTPPDHEGPVDWVTGASVLLRSQALRDAGLFDTGFFLYFEEVELMHRLRARGWLAYHCRDSRVLHLAGASTGVIDGKTEGRRTPPDYVFTARRRYFALTGGFKSAWLAGMGWLLGDMLARVVSRLAPRRCPPASPDERRTLLRLGVRPAPADTMPAIATWNESPGAPPAWMTW